MGYRSDVAIKIQVDEEIKSPQDLIKDLRDRLNLDDDEELDCDELDFTENSLTIVWYSTKWYVGYYPDVDIIDRWFQDCCDAIDENKNGIIGAQKIIIGEDLDDCEEIFEGHLDYYMCVHREIIL